MATTNPFDLLGDDDTEDPSQLIAAQQQPNIAPPIKKAPAVPALQSKPLAKLPSKPLPPTQTVRETKDEGARGGGRGGRGYGRGRGGGFNRDSINTENSSENSRYSGGQGAPEEADTGKPSERRGGYGGPRGPFRGGRRGGFSNGEVADGERPRSRVFERRSGTGRGNEFKRDGAGRGNWGTPTDEITQVTEEVVDESEKKLAAEKPSVEEDAADVNKENPTNESEEKEPENKEMTLEEYEKVLEEKRKALQALKTEERKVDIKVFESMQQIASKKNNEDVFIKLKGSDKDKRAEKEEKAKKSVSINEFLKPVEGERYYNPGGHGRGRGRGGGRGVYSGGSGIMNNLEAPAIEDPGQFPTLGAK